jgi:hypothetical protein
MSFKQIRFMNNNFLERSMTYSSQQTAFPASNATNTSRSKVWKPAGNFEITTSNNKLYINDGSNKTITLTVGAYTYATLASHIQTQLNASSSNWTCAYNNTTTFKFTINRTSGTAVLRLTQTTSAVWDAIGFTGTSDRSTPSFVADEQRNHTSEWLQCDLGVPQQATFAGLLSGIDQIFTLSATATIKAQANNIDFWSTPPVDISVTVGKISATDFLDDITTASYRYHRITIIDRLNYLGPENLEFAYAYVGDHTSVTQSNIASGFTKELTDSSNLLQSESGALFFESRPRYLTITNAQIQLLSDQQREDIEQLFYDLGTRNPFFVSIDPGANVTLNVEELTRFMIMTRSPTLDNIFRNYYNINFEMREAF